MSGNPQALYEILVDESQSLRIVWSAESNFKVEGLWGQECGVDWARYLLRLCFQFYRWKLQNRNKKSIMRRSKRLQAKKSTKFSETEGSSQEEAVDIASLDQEDLVSKAYAEKITTDRQEEVDEDACTSSERITSSQEVEDVSTSSERMILSLQEEAEEDDEEEEEFLTLPTEFKRKFKKE